MATLLSIRFASRCLLPSIRTATQSLVSLSRTHSTANSTPLVYRDPCQPPGNARTCSVANEIPVVSVSVITQDNKMRVVCEGKEEGEMRYHGVWLRHNCRCPQCYDHSAHSTLVRPHQLKEGNTHIEKVTVKGDSVSVVFPDHTGVYPVDWLIQHCYTGDMRDRQEATPLVAESLPVCEYSAVMDTDEGLYNWLRQLVYYGYSLIHNGPTDVDTAERIASRVGFIQESAYGRTFDVLTKDNPDNLAYTTNDLIYHMDLLYHESPPTIQILHCVKNDPCVVGGASILIDAYPVVKQLQVTHPHHFKVLSSVPVPYRKIYAEGEEKYDMKYSAPHITLDNNGEYHILRPSHNTGKYGEVVGIRWNPPVQYPISIPEDMVVDYYDAFTQLSQILEESNLKVTHQLQPGQILTFNNRRILHARTAFKPNGGVRHLHGAYVSGDLLRSKFLVLSDLLGKKEPMKRILINNNCE